MSRHISNITECEFARADVVVIGSGPVGATAAMELVELGLTVILLEGGGLSAQQEEQEKLNADLTDAPQHAPIDTAACRALGGTSHFWGGRCTPFDPIDFDGRPEIGKLDWPIHRTEIECHYLTAFEYLGCSAETFERQDSAYMPHSAGISFGSPEAWCDQPYIGDKLLSFAARNERLKLVTGCFVTSFDVDTSSGRLTALRVKSDAGENTLRPSGKVVLACGGLGNTRLLLNAQAKYNSLFGGQDGHVGKSYQGHVSGVISNVTFADDEIRSVFEYRRMERSFFRWRKRFSDEILRKHKLLNISFWPDNPPMANSQHQDPLLSLIYLTVASPLGAKLLPSAIRNSQIRGGDSSWRHLKNIVLNPVSLISGGAQLVWQKYYLKRRHPLFFRKTRFRRYPLHFHAEQSSSEYNQVTLSDKTDSDGVNRLCIKYRVSDSDAENCYRAHLVLKDLFEKEKLGHIDILDRDEALNKIRTESVDGFHQIGMTKMSSSRKDGVVDKNCELFDLPGVFVVGSSVFPSSGQANPTLAACALAIRLSHYLADLQRGPAITSSNA